MKKFLYIIITFVYNLICVFSLLFCAFYSIKPVYDFFYKHSQSYREYFLEINDGTVFFFLAIMLIGVILAIILAILYKDKSNRIVMLISVIPFITLLFCLYTDFDVEYHFVFKHLYRLFIIGFLSSAVYSNFLLITKTLKNK